MVKKKKKNLDDFTSLIGDKLKKKKIKILPTDLVENTRNKITKFY